MDINFFRYFQFRPLVDLASTPQKATRVSVMENLCQIQALRIFLLSSLLVTVTGINASAMHPDSVHDFEYVNKYSGMRYVIKYLGDGTCSERIAAFPNKERLRWQVNCKRAEVRMAWRDEPYETKKIGSRGLETEIDIWRGRPIRYIQYSCNGPKQFVRFWPAIPITDQLSVNERNIDRHRQCLAAKDYKGCMEYRKNN